MLMCFADPEVRSTARRSRVLIVEDSFLSARSISAALQRSGFDVVGPAPNVDEAMDLLDRVGCDAAVLDINLGNETAEPVAQRLADSGRPFLFLTGYSAPTFNNAELKHRDLLAKPPDFDKVIRVLNTLLDQP